MASIAIITARGGSKRIPKKNIKDFCGKPIIAYSIEAAINSGVFNEVMVSTDSEEIAAVAKNYGAKIPFFRSAATSNDFATTADVLEEVLNQYEELGQKYDVLCCIYPTAPFVTAEKLKKAFEKMHDEQADSVMPIVQFSFPPQRAVVIREGKLQYNQLEYETTRSQDLEPLYHDCGQFYICKVEVFKTKHSLITKNTVPFIMPEEEVQDIDNLSDWKLAEMKFQLMKWNRK
jgi:N-acylneuraminate cytidylyltransferase